MDKQTVDVAVIGDGPAGSTVALKLSKLGLSVVLLGLPSSSKKLFGETLSPHIKAGLIHLGVWKDFLNDEHLPSTGNISAWGDTEIKENNFIFHPDTYGWHKIWKLKLRRDDKLINSKFLVDATGRTSWFSRRQGIRRLVFDHLCGYVSFHFSRTKEDSDSMTLIESAPDGWWYSALLPKDIRVTYFFTSNNLPITRYVKTRRGWEKIMQKTKYIINLQSLIRQS